MNGKDDGSPEQRQGLERDILKTCILAFLDDHYEVATALALSHRDRHLIINDVFSKE